MLVIFTLPETNISLANGLWDAYFQGATLVLGRVDYIGDYMTQLYIGIVPSHDEDPVINRSRFHGMLKGLFASRCSGFIYTFFLLKMLLSLFVSTDEMQHIC